MLAWVYKQWWRTKVNSYDVISGTHVLFSTYACVSKDVNVFVTNSSFE
jgi:hypothetical protein